MEYAAMIVLDTHMWVWWVHDDQQLSKEYKEYIEQNEQSGIGVSAISCWEVAKLVEYGRLTLPIAINVILAIPQATYTPSMRTLTFNWVEATGRSPLVTVVIVHNRGSAR